MPSRVGRAARRSKYGAVKTVLDGERFDSKAEAQYWAELKLREQAGEVRNIRRQVKFPLTVRGISFTGDYTICTYVADFCYDEWAMWKTERHADMKWIPRIVDVKSPATRKLATYRIKAKWMAANGNPITEITRGRAASSPRQERTR